MRDVLPPAYHSSSISYLTFEQKKYRALCTLMTECESSFADLLEYLGEKPTMSTDEFFSTLQKFTDVRTSFSSISSVLHDISLVQEFNKTLNSIEQAEIRERRAKARKADMERMRRKSSVRKGTTEVEEGLIPKKQRGRRSQTVSN